MDDRKEMMSNSITSCPLILKNKKNIAKNVFLFLRVELWLVRNIIRILKYVSCSCSVSLLMLSESKGTA